MANRTAHYFLPDNAFSICHICGGHAEKEENEISRHYRAAHRATHPMYTGRGNTPYKLIKLVPQQVAEDLASQQRVGSLNRRLSYTAENAAPKSEYASVTDMTRLYGLRGLAVPAWVATFVWPSVAAGPVLQAATPPTPPVLPPTQPQQLVQQHLATLLNQGSRANDDDDEEESMADADDDEDPSAAPGETVYKCLVHQRENTGPQTHMSGRLRSMYNHYNQWHPERLRQAFHDSYDALYVEELITRGLSNRALADAAEVVIESSGVRGAEGPQTLRCYVCMGEAGSFEELDRHYRDKHEDERWSIAEGIFDQWTN